MAREKCGGLRSGEVRRFPGCSRRRRRRRQRRLLLSDSSFGPAAGGESDGNNPRWVRRQHQQQQQRARCIVVGLAAACMTGPLAGPLHAHSLRLLLACSLARSLAINFSLYYNSIEATPIYIAGPHTTICSFSLASRWRAYAPPWVTDLDLKYTNKNSTLQHSRIGFEAGAPALGAKVTPWRCVSSFSVGWVGGKL